MPALLLLAAAATYTVAGIYMKLSVGLTRPLPSLLLFVAVIPGVALQAVAMRHLQLSVAVLLVLGLEAILAVVFGALLFHERAGWPKVLGVVLVVAGVAVLHTTDP